MKDGMAPNSIAERPQLRLKLRPLERLIDAVALLAVASTIGMVMIAWPGLPDRIAHHFDFAGNPDAWGSRGVLAFLPAISAAMYALLTFVSRSPHRFNYAWAITEQNAERQYRIGRSMLLTLKAEVAILFAYMTWIMIRTASDNSESLGRAFIPIVVGSVLLTITTHLAAAFRAR